MASDTASHLFHMGRVYRVMEQFITNSFNKKLNDRRGTTRRSMSIEILSNAAQVYKKMQLNRLAMEWVNDLDGHSRSSEMMLFDWPYITSY